LSTSKFKHIPRIPEENSTVFSANYVKYLTESALALGEITLTLYVLETPDASNTVTNAYVMHMEIIITYREFGKDTDGRTSYPRF